MGSERARGEKEQHDIIYIYICYKCAGGLYGTRNEGERRGRSVERRVEHGTRERKEGRRKEERGGITQVTERKVCERERVSEMIM